MRLVETKYVHYIAYKIPVYDELRRFEAQMQRELKVMLGVGDGDRVVSLTAQAKVTDSSLDGLLISGLPEVLTASVPACSVGGKSGLVQNLKALTEVETSSVEGAEFGTSKMSLCGREVQVTRSKPTMTEDLRTPPESYSIVFR